MKKKIKLTSQTEINIRNFMKLDADKYGDKSLDIDFPIIFSNGSILEILPYSKGIKQDVYIDECFTEDDGIIYLGIVHVGKTYEFYLTKDDELTYFANIWSYEPCQEERHWNNVACQNERFSF